MNGSRPFLFNPQPLEACMDCMTMIGSERLRDVWRILDTARHLPGDFVPRGACIYFYHDIAYYTYSTIACIYTR